MTAPGFPAPLNSVILQALEEIVGPDDVRTVLDLCGLPNLDTDPRHANGQREISFESLSLLEKALEQIYGSQAGKGLAMRIGRCSFYHILRLYGATLHLTSTGFRLLPISQKIKTNLNILADLLTRNAQQSVIQTKQVVSQFVWEVRHPVMNSDNTEKFLACNLIVGLLQESLYWASGGKIFKITETNCINCGDPLCTFEIDPNPIG